MSSKVIQIVPATGLLAVVKHRDAYNTVKVSAIEIVEDANGQHERLIFPYMGKLTNSDDLPEYLGCADTPRWAEYVFVQSLGEAEHKAYFDRIEAEEKEKYKPLHWNDSGVERPAISGMIMNR